MPDIPQSVRDAVDAALDELPQPESPFERDRWRIVSRVTLEAAALLLAETVAQGILAHMEAHGPGPASPGVTLHETMRRAWRRHFGIAARVAAGAFYTREDELRLAAKAIERGDFIACDIPEVPVTTDPGILCSLHQAPLYEDMHAGEPMGRYLCPEKGCTSIVAAGWLASARDQMWCSDNGMTAPGWQTLGADPWPDRGAAESGP